MAIVVDSLYLVLDAIVITLGLLFVWKWGKKGLLAMTMWLLVIGLMAYAVGDGLYLMGNDLGYKTTLFTGSAYEMESADFAFIGAVVLWIVAFFIPVKFAFFDAKKRPQGGEGPPEAPMPPQQQNPGPVPPPQYQQATPPPYQQPPR